MVRSIKLKALTIIFVGTVCFSGGFNSGVLSLKHSMGSNKNFQESQDSLLKQKVENDLSKVKSLLASKENDQVPGLLNQLIKTNDSMAVKDERLSNEIADIASRFYLRQGEFEKAIEISQVFIDLASKQVNWDKLSISYSYSVLMQAYLMLSDYEAVIEKAIDPNELLLKKLISETERIEDLDYLKIGLLVNYNYAILVNMRSSNVVGVKENIVKIENLLKTIEEFNPSTKPIIEDIYTTLIDFSIINGDFDKALLFINFYKNLYENPEILTQIRILDKERKLAFRQKEYDQTIKIHKEIERLFMSEKKQDFILHFYRLSLEHYAEVLNKDDYLDVDLAIATNKKSIELLKDKPSTNFENKIYAFRNLAELYQRIGVTDSAKVYFEKAINESQDLRIYESLVTVKLGKIEFYIEDLGDESILLEETRSILKIAGIANLDSLKLVEEKKLPIKSDVSFLNVFSGLGDLHLEMYKLKQRKENLEISHKMFLLASQILSDVRMSNKFNQLEVEALNKVNNGLLETLNLIEKSDLAETQISTTLKCLESNQNIEMLYRHHMNGIVFNNQKLPDSLLLLKRRYERKIREFDEKITNDYNAVVGDSLRVKLLEQKFKIEYQLDSIYKVINKLSPEFSLYQMTDFNIKTIQNNMSDDTQIIRYFFSDSSLYQFNISKSNIGYKYIAERDNLNNAIQQTYGGISTNNNGHLDDLNKILASSFDGLDQISNLRIIPHLNLNLIPFEIFDSNGKALLESFNISYGNSLFLTNNVREREHNAIACFAPNYNINNKIENSATQQLVRSGIYELKGAKKEAENIAQMFDGDLFLNQRATKRNFQENAKNYSILHLAMHALVDQENSNNSMLLFTKDSKDPILSISDIYNLNIDAELTVLSACNTGNGKVDASEGVLSLSRAFMFAGSSATIMSLWKVPDKQTSQIMTDFYRNLKSGQTKSIALRNAKLDYLDSTEDDNFKHPYYWAGFVLSGDTSAIISSDSYWYYIILALIVILGVGFLIKKTVIKSEVQSN